MTKYAAAREGLRSGVDLSKVQIDRTDWGKKIDRDFRDMESALKDVRRKEEEIWKDENKKEDRKYREEREAAAQEFRKREAALDRQLRRD